jgi:uncharacterized protein YkwD
VYPGTPGQSVERPYCERPCREREEKMPRSISRRLPALVLIAWTLGASTCGFCAPTPARGRAPDLSGAARQRVNRLLGNFRRSKRSPEQRAAAAAEILSLGPAAAAKLLEAVNVELAPLLARYEQDYQQTATALAARRPVDPQEVAALRQAILSLKDDPQLTKETIVSRGDPAYARLIAILSVKEADVFGFRPALKPQREALAALGAYWQAARRIAAQADATNGTGQSADSFADRVASAQEAAATLAMPMDDAARRVLVENSRLAEEINPEAAQGIAALNRLRVALALRPLRIDPRLCLTAIDHSSDMRTKNFFDHTSPVPGKTTFVDRAANFGTTASAENIAQARDAPTAIEMWWHSPGHHRNMLGDHQRVGLGHSDKFWTQLFGR